MVGGFLHLGQLVCRGVFSEQKAIVDIKAGHPILGGVVSRLGYNAATWHDFQILWPDAI
ncbi:MAG: hypothetical protein ACI83E_000974 [Sulfitobacter sp.]|jgi:hypothetical protein